MCPAVEAKVIFLYSEGVSTRDIQKTMREICWIEVDGSRVSKITDKLLPMIREWQECPLQSVYAMVRGTTKANPKFCVYFIRHETG